MPSANPWIRRVPTPAHGSASSNGLRAAYDFSQNLNPLGPPPGILSELQEAIAEAVRYPALDRRSAAESLAEYLGLNRTWVALGNGSSELILLIAVAFLSRGRTALVLCPSYMEYERASLAVAARVARLRLCPERDFRWDPDDLRDAVSRWRAAVVWLGNPHNPTGQPLEPEALKYLVGQADDVLWVVDEAYVELSECASAVELAGSGNLIVLRSITKALALPGIRLGYAVAHPRLIDSVLRVAPPWGLSTLAETLARLAPNYQHHVEAGARLVRKIRPWMMLELASLGLHPFPSSANFLMVEAREPEQVLSGLLEWGIMIRDCTSLGLAGFLRIAVRPKDEVQVLLSRLKEVIG